MKINFAILKHTLLDQSFHFDLLIKNGNILNCWQFNSSPTNCDDSEILFCKKIFDHRLKYLTYEGEISDNRGWVSRTTNGILNIETQNSKQVIFRVANDNFKGRFSLTKTALNWIFSKVSD